MFEKDIENYAILKEGDVYVAERVYRGTTSGFSASTGGYTPSATSPINYLSKDSGKVLQSNSLPSGTGAPSEIEVFEKDGDIITSGSDKIYLGHLSGETKEHTMENNLVTAKYEKNGVTVMEDVAGQSVMFKFKIPNVSDEDWRQFIDVTKKDTNGGFPISSSPKAENFNRSFMVSFVQNSTSGKTWIKQYRNCRIKIPGMSGGGTEYVIGEVEVTALPDYWANQEFNIGYSFEV